MSRLQKGKEWIKYYYKNVDNRIVLCDYLFLMPFCYEQTSPLAVPMYSFGYPLRFGFSILNHFFLFLYARKKDCLSSPFLLTYVRQIQEVMSIFCNIVFSFLKLVAQENIKHFGSFFCVVVGYTD